MKSFAILAIAGVLVGCGAVDVIPRTAPSVVGSGRVTTVAKQVGNFRSVSLDGAFDAYVVVGPDASLKIEGDDNVVKLVRTKLTDGKLALSTEGAYSTHHPLRVLLTTRVLESLALNGSGNVVVRNYSGPKFAVVINGSGSLSAAGSSDLLEASIAGSGDLKLAGLHTRYTSISIGGSGNAEVFASERLDGDIDGSGSIRYAGNPKQIGRTVMGTGSIEPM